MGSAPWLWSNLTANCAIVWEDWGVSRSNSRLAAGRIAGPVWLRFWFHRGMRMQSTLKSRQWECALSWLLRTLGKGLVEPWINDESQTADDEHKPGNLSGTIPPVILDKIPPHVLKISRYHDTLPPFLEFVIARDSRAGDRETWFHDNITIAHKFVNVNNNIYFNFV